MLQTLLEKLFKSGKIVGAQSKGVVDQTAKVIDHALPNNHDRRKWVVLGFLSMPVLGALVAVAGTVGSVDVEAGRPTLGEIVTEQLDVQLDEVHTFDLAPLPQAEKIRSGDNIVTILKRVGIEDGELIGFVNSDETARKLFHLRAGRHIDLQTNTDGSLNWLRYELNSGNSYQESVLIKRSAQGAYNAEIERVEFEKEISVRSGEIESSLFAAADKSDLPEDVAVQMAEIFSSTIDFNRELRVGDNFRVVFEAYHHDGMRTGNGRVLAVEFVNDGKAHKAYYFEQADNEAGYYDDSGQSMKKSFLRSPLKFSRISSGFTPRRYHPIQKRWKAHNGVDYAAPTGTPVRSTAKGKVTFVGNQRGYGKIVILEHNNGYATRYAHLSRFAKGLRKGDRVDQGELIGYVGSTGWATGPHLHYEFHVKGKPVNPLSMKFMPAEPLNRADMQRFKTAQLALDKRLDLAATMRVAQAR